jgi:hypothetical protein
LYGKRKDKRRKTVARKYYELRQLVTPKVS